MDEDVPKLLIKHNEAELLYDIACRVQLEDHDLEKIMEKVDSRIPPERMKEGYNALAARAEKHSDFTKAYQYYHQAENTAAVDALYQKIFKTHVAPDHIDILLTIADETNTKQNSRAAETVYAILKKPELLRFSPHIPQHLTEMVRRHKVRLSKSQDELLKDALISQLSLYELDKVAYDKDALTLRWAKFHAQDWPESAYRIFKSREYQGPEVNTAVRQWLINRTEQPEHYDGLSADQISEIHLRQAYETLPLEVKATVALHLKDSRLLQDLSRQYSRNRKEGSISAAYRLWIRGEGDQNDLYVKKLRTSMIKKELAKEYGPSVCLFEPDDAIGNKLWFTHLIEREPEKAYAVAQRIQDQHLLQQAREKIVKLSPSDALQKFKGYQGDFVGGYHKEDTDAVGMNMALDALAEQYSVPRQRIDEYLALQK